MVSEATLFVLPAKRRSHPARYTKALLTTFARMLDGAQRILDPFGGEGGVFLLENWLPGVQIEAIEIEDQWAVCHPRTTLGNALALPWEDGYFDAICTSPAYGNRLSDKRRPEGSKWKKGVTTYADMLGEDLHPDNLGGLPWGDVYRAKHTLAWIEADRVLRPGGRFVLNCKNHIRNGELQLVTEWHIECLSELGFEMQRELHGG